MHRFFRMSGMIVFILLAVAGMFLPAQGIQAQAEAAGLLQVSPTAAFIQPVITATPNPDGSVIHKVESGQSLWGIATAYGVSIARLQELNNLDPNAVLLLGQTIIIQPSSTPTLSPVPSLTPVPPTRTPSPTPLPRTPTLTFTAIPTATQTPAPLIDWQPPAWMNQETLGLGLIIISGAGLLFVLIAAFRRK